MVYNVVFIPRCLVKSVQDDISSKNFPSDCITLFIMINKYVHNLNVSDDQGYFSKKKNRGGRCYRICFYSCRCEGNQGLVGGVLCAVDSSGDINIYCQNIGTLHPLRWRYQYILSKNRNITSTPVEISIHTVKI